MSYVALGAIGEFIAAIATVITLIYLVFQIRLNNRLAISTLEHKLNSRVYDRRLTISRDTEFSEFLAKDWNSTDLTKIEKTKISQYIAMLIGDAREVFLQDKLGFVSADSNTLKARVNVLKMGIMENVTSKSVWASYRNLVEPDFARFFEEHIFPDGLEEDVETEHPLYKPSKQ
jgi:hypothetical protein